MHLFNHNPVRDVGGTVLETRLPLAERHEATIVRTDEMITTVAIVEDDAILRNSLAKLIGGARGIRCLATCASAEEALEQLPGLMPGVVLMDLNLPQMSGAECIR